MFADVAKQSERKRWRDQSTNEKIALIALSAAQFALSAWAQRDLSDRDHHEVRGPKLMWRLVNMITVVGPVAYLLLGRRGD
jgi:hypothetical protein